ncbi:MAG: hypothetical protein Q4P17_00790 [Methanobacterium sp.]|nr:hypothetical protein [Methanobacterium sp.]
MHLGQIIVDTMAPTSTIQFLMDIKAEYMNELTREALTGIS